ncbi:MAG: hypothetical protein U9Q06_02405 [Nanoarchaeota archaeon]|nr:hypothetical protein [Nanoarchaeota archaeon]
MKRGLLTLVILVLLLVVVSAQTENESINLENAYECVKDKVGDSCNSLTSKQQTHVILAIGGYKDCEDSFLNTSQIISPTQECWPKSNCNVKETSLALLALRKLGKPTINAENWLLNQTKTASDLIWFLQIDADKATTCTVTYNSLPNTITIAEDKTISSDAGSCLTRSSGNYWLQIGDGSTCLNQEYTISCDEDFKTNLIYKTRDSPTIHVSQILNTATAGGKTTEKVNYKCFTKGTGCDYESSLWATLVLLREYEVSNYLPYLRAAADSNSNLFPESFLHIVDKAHESEYLPVILSTNFNGQYWSAKSGNKFYDTALAFLALQDRTYEEVDKSKSYLLNGKIQDSKGCWQTMSDTALLLYTGWNGLDLSEDEEIVIPPECESDDDCGQDETCIEGVCVDDSDEIAYCVAHNYFCVSSSWDCTDAGGEVLDNFNCVSSFDTCCSVDVEEIITPAQTCEEAGGEFCAEDESCPSSHLISDISDSSYLNDCCEIGKCVEDEEEPKTCTEAGGICRTKCGEDETTVTGSCDFNSEVCCKEDSPPGKFPWWILVLIFLIFLIILLIVFKDKIKLYIFKKKSRYKPGAVKRPGPPTFPPRPRRPIPQRPIPQMQRPAPITRQPQVSSKDKEFDDTLKKLREMSK